MKRMTLLCLSLLFVNLFFAQEPAIKVTNPSSGKEVIIKDNKRIKIRTADGQKISGRFKIVDSNTIFIDNMPVELMEIHEVKRNPLLTSIFTSTFFIYGGALAIGFGSLIGILVDSSAYFLILPGAGMIYTGIKSPNFNRKFKRDKNWTFDIITGSQ